MRMILNSRTVGTMIGILLVCMTGCERDMTLERERAAGLFERAKAAIDRKDHQDTRRLLLEVAALDGRMRNVTRRAETLLLLSENYVAGGRFDSAAILADEASALYTQLGDKTGVLAAVRARVNVLQLTGEYDDAYKLLHTTLQVEEVLGNLFAGRELKWAMVPVARAAGNPAAERRLLRELMQDYEKTGDRAMQARAGFELGASYLLSGNIAQAKQHLDGARSLADAAGDSLAAIAVMQLQGVAAQAEGNAAAAMRYFASAMRRSDVTRGAERLREELLLRAGNLLLRQRKYEEAIKYLNVALRSAIQTQHRLVEAYALLQLAHCNAALGKEDAARQYESGAELMTYIGIPAANAYASVCLGRYVRETGYPSQALEHFQHAVDAADSSVTAWEPLHVFDDCEQTVYDTYATTPYDEYIGMLLQLGRHEEAFLATERKNRMHVVRSLISLDIITRDEAATAGLASLRRLYGSYGGVERQLAYAFAERAESIPLSTELKRSLRTIRNTIREMGDSLVVSLKQYSDLLVPPSHPTLTEIQQRLTPDAALLAYHPVARSLHVFVVTRSDFASTLAATGRPELERAMQAYIQMLEAPQDSSAKGRSVSALTDISMKLYAAYVLPAEKEIAEASRLFIMLPADLHIFPIHSVIRDKFSPPLIEKYGVRYVTDAGMLRPSGRRPGLSPTGVAFGNAGTTSWDVEYELSDLRAFVKETRFYINDGATFAELRKQEGDVLHMALEFRCVPHNPSRSFIVLNTGTGYAALQYPRFGTLFSIAPFANIVLSNLSTIPLDGIAPRILHLNGTSDVVLNGFLPSRKAKKQFTELYYSLVLSGNSAEQACRQAGIVMRQNAEYAHPAMWGAFMVW